MVNLKASKHTLFDEFEIKGEWWLPNAPEDKVAGILMFKKKEIKLELIGSWNNGSLIAAFEMNSLDVILGQSGKNEIFTLMDMMPINQSTTLNGYSTVTYSVDSFIEGGHFNQKKDILFSSSTIYPTYLTKWLNRNALSFSVDNDSQQVTTKYIAPERFKYYISSIEATVQEESNLVVEDYDFNKRVEMNHASGISILAKKSQSIEWFNERTNELGNLISTLIGKGIYLEKIYFKGNPVEITTPWGKKVFKQETYTYFKKQYDIRLKEKFNERDIVVHFSEIENSFESVLNNWYEKYKELEVIHNLYFGFLYNAIHIDTTFLNSVQMLEIYHRKRYRGKIFEEEFFKLEKIKLKGLSKRNVDKEFHKRVMELMTHANDFSLNKRLSEIIDSLSMETKDCLIGKPEEIRIFIRQLVDTRNFLAHYDENRKPHLIKGVNERFYAIKRLEALVTLLLLKETGLDEKKLLDKVKSSMHYSYNLKKAKELLNDSVI